MIGTALTTIEISKDYLHFNSAHFTIFSAAEREDLRVVAVTRTSAR